MLSASAWATLMKTKCMQSSHKHQQINKNKVPKPNESALIIKLVTSVAPSARPFPSDPPPRAAGVCQSKQEHRFPPPPPRDAAASHRLRLRRRGSWPCVSPLRCSHFFSLSMICDPIVDSEIVKSRTHNFSLNLHYSHHNRASHSISKC